MDNKLNIENTINISNKMSEVKMQKPFLKWVGGKTQIINNIVTKFPNTINNYHELFLGGGSVLLALLSLQKENKIVIKENIYAYDINKNLITVYQHIQNNKDELYKYVNMYISQYDSIKGITINRKHQTNDEAKTSKESYLYWIRSKYNQLTDKKTILSSAMFIFLNKTCFRG